VPPACAGVLRSSSDYTFDHKPQWNRSGRLGRILYIPWNRGGVEALCDWLGVSPRLVVVDVRVKRDIRCTPLPPVSFRHGSRPLSAAFRPWDSQPSSAIPYDDTVNGFRTGGILCDPPLQLGDAATAGMRASWLEQEAASMGDWSASSPHEHARQGIADECRHVHPSLTRHADLYFAERVPACRKA